MNKNTLHFEQERKEREIFIRDVIGIGNVIETFIVERGHSRGIELHKVTDTAIIAIHNQKTNELITELIARPEQLRRLYSQRGEKPPRWLLRKAFKNNSLRYNEK